MDCYRHYRSQQLVLFAQKGDPLREATGIRPSLHPVTINAIAEALKVRAKKLEDMPLRPREDVAPLQIAMSAGRIATEAIQKRQEASSRDGMTLLDTEEQTIAGRVMGVVMRLDNLESLLQAKCASVSWISKYGEWGTFGLLGDKDVETPMDVDDRVLIDPLFSMSRSECLLALFLHTVERPSLEQIGETVPGGSIIDFLDADRKEVLIDD